MGYNLLKLIHIVSFVMLGGVLFGILAKENERAAFQPAFSYHLDAFFEQSLRFDGLRAIIAATTSLATGLLLIAFGFSGWSGVAENPVLIAKLTLWVVLVAVLHYEHLGVGRKLTALIEECRAGDVISDGYLASVRRYRERRRNLAAVGLFLTLTMIVLGIQVHMALPAGLTTILIVAAALASLRARSSVMRFGWF